MQTLNFAPAVGPPSLHSRQHCHDRWWLGFVVDVLVGMGMEQQLEQEQERTWVGGVRGFLKLCCISTSGKEDLWFLYAIVMSWLLLLFAIKGHSATRITAHLDSQVSRKAYFGSNNDTFLSDDYTVFSRAVIQ